MARGLLIASAALLLALAVHQSVALTDPDEKARMEAFRDAMLARPQHANWAKALASWTCPTPSDNSDNSDCDPCGQQVWGNWDHLACRGAPIGGYNRYAVPGTGKLTNVHITDYSIEGLVPLKELCGFKALREFDVDGGTLTGPIPTGFAACFPDLKEIDLSYNRLSGEIPADIAAVPLLQQFKAEVNNLSGGIPPEFGTATKMNWLRFAKNRMGGNIPDTLAATAPHLSQLTLDNNDFEGSLYPLAQHRLISFSAHQNPKLCGMVPVGVRYAHGFNFHATGLGVPCADEIANGLETA